MIVFSPWAFGTTQPWSITVMNAGGLLLGLLLVCKWSIRKSTGLTPERWSEGPPRWLTVTLVALTVLPLLYCLISAANGRAAFTEADSSFVYQDCISWLPHSYDAGSTWSFFWRWFALALVFWAARDFLLTGSAAPSKREGPPARLKRLLWLLSINGGLLALEGLVQRALGSTELLWILEPRINKSPEAQFGPYAYRSNATQYLLLAWPVALGFWSWIKEERRREGPPVHNYLLPCVLMMAMVPLFSLSRAGAIIGVVTLIGAALVLLVKGRKQGDRTSVIVAITLLIAIVLGGLVEWGHLTKRFASDPLDSGRHEIWRNTWQMIQDYRVYGTGPGTFASVYHMYRPSAEDNWAAHAHNDWLEALVTFGIVGATPIFAALALILLWPWFCKGRRLPGAFKTCVYLSMGSCLAYSILDLPLKVYSIAFLFVLVTTLATLEGNGRRFEDRISRSKDGSSA